MPSTGPSGKRFTMAKRPSPAGVQSIGTTSLVHPAAGLPVIAQRNGAQLVEINPTGTPLSAQADQCLRSTATAALTAIRDQLRAALAG